MRRNSLQKLFRSSVSIRCRPRGYSATRPPSLSQLRVDGHVVAMLARAGDRTSAADDSTGLVRRRRTRVGRQRLVCGPAKQTKQSRSLSESQEGWSCGRGEERERRTHRARSSNPSSRPASNAVDSSRPPVVEVADEDDVDEAMDESDDLLWASWAAALRLARIWDSRDSRGAVGVLGPDLRSVEKRPMWCRLGWL